MSNFREEWSAMTFYERFEQAVILVLTGLIMVVVLASMWSLLRQIGVRLVLGALDPLEYSTFQAVFGSIFTVVIALEFKRSLLVVVERRFGIVQVRSVILIAMLAIVRKFIILDLPETDSMKIIALSCAALFLGVVYWLVRDQDRKEREEFV